MALMRRASRALVASMGANVVLLGVVALKVRLVGLRVIAQKLAGRPAELPDFAGIARTRFLPGAEGLVTFLGDSQVEYAPLLEMLDLPYRNRGLGHARIANVLDWLDPVLAEHPRHLVVMIGSNDVYFGVPLADSLAAGRRLLDRIAEHTGCAATFLSVPPVSGHEATAAQLNAALSELVTERGYAWLDITPTLSAMAWTDDTLHLNAAAYRAIAPALRAALPD
jgi:lysophospholipase L1-like esterase